MERFANVPPAWNQYSCRPSARFPNWLFVATSEESPTVGQFSELVVRSNFGEVADSRPVLRTGYACDFGEFADGYIRLLVPLVSAMKALSRSSSSSVNRRRSTPFSISNFGRSL